jgi:hypothetical protein
LPGAKRGTHQRLRRNGERIENQRKEIPQLQHDLVRSNGRGAEPRRDRGSRDETRLERQGPEEQIAPHGQLC